MKSHRYADLFPMMGADALKDDIAAHGVIEPIVIYQGAILDGRNRFAAAQALGIDAPTVEFIGTDDEALARALSLNLHRRHLDTSQRAMVAAGLANVAHGGNRKSSNQQANLPLDRAAQMFSVSRRSVSSAKAVRDANASLAQKVLDGQMTLNAAVRAIKPPKACASRDGAADELAQIRTLLCPDEFPPEFRERVTNALKLIDCLSK